MNIEVWKNIPEFQGYYQVSNHGRVRSLERSVFHSGDGKFHTIKGRILSSRINNCGYLSVRFNKHGKSHTRFIHRLIAQVFIENPEYKKFINHKNGIKTDNRIENLEWVTHSENMKHAYRLGLIRRKRNTENILMKHMRVNNKKHGKRMDQEKVFEGNRNP